MLAVGMLIVLAGYGLGSWGWNLNKGYNVPFGDWFTPVKFGNVRPWEWPDPGDPIPAIPDTQVNPSGTVKEVAGKQQAGP